MSNHDENRPLTRRELRMREMAAEQQASAQQAAEQHEAAERDAEQRAVAYRAAQQRAAEQSRAPRQQFSVAPDLSYLQEAQQQARKNWQSTGAEDTQSLIKRRREDSIFNTGPAPARPRLKTDSFFEDEEEAFIPEPSPEYVSPSRRSEPRASFINEEHSKPDVAPPTEPFSLEDLREAEKAAPPEALKPKVDNTFRDEDVDTVSIPAHHLKQASRAAARAEKALKDALQDQKESYSYPDIKPIDQRRSIFDAPGVSADASDDLYEPQEEPTQQKDEQPEPPVRTTAFGQVEQPEISQPPVREQSDDWLTASAPKTETASPVTDFNAILERAVSDENKNGSSVNTSALILPTMPDLDLNRPMGETGEVFITGSLELPRSLSETGGHSAQLDREVEDDSGPLDIFSGYDTTEFDARPKSANLAVSSKQFNDSYPTTPVTKTDNKKPLVLGLIGGGLVLAIVVAGVIMFSTGLLG